MNAYRNVVINFPNIETAELFIREWGQRTLRGYTRSAIKDDGSFDVKVYDVSEQEYRFIINYIERETTC